MIRFAFALAGLALLAGCGLRGELERPVPMWGNPPNEGAKDPRTLKAQAEEEAAAKKAKADREAAERATSPTPAPTASPAPK